MSLRECFVDVSSSVSSTVNVTSGGNVSVCLSLVFFLACVVFKSFR